ncbi:rCG28969 [Rattus norvegicus]|uniref:RCG28969 n=1 Tax=Rattus norvegicus TaxID=10116 RepID=A6HW79_RAT|nr:rCG28969 [Rattus norvegicus]
MRTSSLTPERKQKWRERQMDSCLTPRRVSCALDLKLILSSPIANSGCYCFRKEMTNETTSLPENHLMILRQRPLYQSNLLFFGGQLILNGISGGSVSPHQTY